MADDPKTKAPPAAEPAPAAPAAPALPDSITLAADYAWFAKGNFVQRNAGDLVTDADEIAYLVGVGAKVA